MKEYNDTELDTVNIPLNEYRKLQQLKGRVSALIDMIGEQDSTFADVNDILRILGQTSIACERELVAKKKAEEAKGIEVIMP